MNNNRSNPLGLAYKAALGNQLWKLHQEWLLGHTPDSGNEELLSHAELGRKVNTLMLAWMDSVISRQSERRRDLPRLRDPEPEQWLQ